MTTTRLLSYHRCFWIFLTSTWPLMSLPVEGFVPSRSNLPACAKTFGRAGCSNAHAQESDEDDWNYYTPPASAFSFPEANKVGPEKSQMYGYIADYLKRTKNNDNVNDDDTPRRSKFTHLIAVPMGSCHELAIELESVQRAILYHCPALVHACLVPATTRLPLLYVDAPPSQVSSTEATEALAQILEQVVQKQIFVSSAARDETGPSGHNEDSPLVLDGVNSQGVRPLTVTFQSLEIDGPKNDALHTVALPDDPGTARLQKLVVELRNEIQSKLNWETGLPPDIHIVNDNDGVPPVFRPRLPFMRLPTNFRDFLDPLPSDDDDDLENENENELFRTSEQGGNGISPIFWATWWDDVFGMARLREIGIYPRSSTSSSASVLVEGLAENAFYMPQHLTALPDGNEALTQQEAKFESYQDQRLKQAEYDARQDQERKRGGNESRQNSDDTLLLEKTRDRLKTLYRNDMQNLTKEKTTSLFDKDDTLEDTFQSDPERPKVDASLLDDWTQEHIRKANAAKGITMYDDDDEEASNVGVSSTDIASDGNPMTRFEDANELLDAGMRDRISKVVDSREIVKARERLAADKDKVPIEDNPILKKYKEGTLVSESKKSAGSDSYDDLDPFPAREHFLGFWEVMSSPTGLPADDDGGGSKSENLILRVDGTTAGGPILDPLTQQKAAGGTWKVTLNEDGDTSSAELRIRLVIPPKKERILVMQGTAKQGPLLSLAPPMASKTFGVPMLEEKARRAMESDQEALGDLVDKGRIRCTGKVWLEDAITGNNKMEIGEFSLLKLKTPRDPKEYTITIPRPVRNQD